MLQHTIRESRRLIYTTTSALRLLVVILCYPGAFAPSTPVPDPTPGMSGVFELGGAEAGDAARAAVRGGRSGSTAAYGGAALIVATVAGGRTLPVPLRVVRVRAGACV